MRSMEVRRTKKDEFGEWRFRHAARKLLAAPAPDNTATIRKIPNTVVIIVAAMACVLFFVTVAVLLVRLSVIHRRRIERELLIERERREGNAGESADQTSSTTLAAAAAAAPPPVDSPEFDDAVLVKLPGDEKPQFFALPKPFLSDALPEEDLKKPSEVATRTEEKEPSSGDPILQEDAHSERDPANPVVEDSCVPSSDGHLHNRLFPPR